MPWTISGLQFDTVDKQLDEAVPNDIEIRRPGADGTAFHVDAWRAASQDLTTTVRLEAAALARRRAECFALQTTTVSLSDQFGASWTVYVRRVRLTSFLNPDGYATLIALWTLVPQSVRP